MKCNVKKFFNLTDGFNSFHVKEILSLFQDFCHQVLEVIADGGDGLDRDVVEVDHDRRFRVQDDLHVDAGGKRIVQLDEVFVEGTEKLFRRDFCISPKTSICSNHLNNQ